MCPSKIKITRPDGVAKKLLNLMCSEVWLTSYELLMLYEYHVDENVNTNTMYHMIWELKDKGLLDFKRDPNGRIGPGGRSYLYRKKVDVPAS